MKTKLDGRIDVGRISISVINKKKDHFLLRDAIILKISGILSKIKFTE